MVSLPLDRIGAEYATDPSKVWAVDPENFDRTVFPGNQNTCGGYIRPCMLYGLLGFDPINTTSYATQYGIGAYSCINVMVPQGKKERLGEYGNNWIYYGDILSTNNPAGNVTDTYSPKFMRKVTVKVPGFSGKFNFLKMGFESGTGQYWTWCNPYHIVEMQSDLLKITDLLNLFYPFNFTENQLSNFIFVPFVWANNLFQSWSKDPGHAAVDTTNATPSTMTNETSGRLSAPSKMNPNRKKALILVVNKPDWFEPGELTYLGYDNDYSEIPMIESDCIRGDIDYSDTTKYFADGTNYDGTIQGAKKILKLEVLSGDFSRSAGIGWYRSNGTSQIRLKFPKKYLLKIVAKPRNDSSWTNHGSAYENIYQNDGHLGWFYDSVCYDDGKLYFARNNSYYPLHFGYCDYGSGTWHSMPARFKGDIMGDGHTYWTSLHSYGGTLFTNHCPGPNLGGEIWYYDTVFDRFPLYVTAQGGSKWSTIIYNNVMYYCGYDSYLGSYDGASLDSTSRYIGNGVNATDGGINRSLCAFGSVKPPKIEPVESLYSEIQKRKQKKEERYIRETNGVGLNYILGEKFRS